MSDFDASLYTRAPKFSVPAGITLARALVEACPTGMPALVYTARDKLAATADRAQADVAARQRVEGSDVDRRGLDRTTDISWEALEERLDAWTKLPVTLSPDVKRAAELLNILFGTGPDRMAFLRESFPVQLTKSEAILARIDKDGLQPDIDRLAGPIFLAHVRTMHAQYDRMVKDSLLADDDPDMRKHQRALSQAIVRYALALCATVDEDIPGSADKVRTALHAIVQLRTDNARRSASRAGAGESDTDQPAPDDGAPASTPATDTEEPTPEPV